MKPGSRTALVSVAHDNGSLLRFLVRMAPAALRCAIALIAVLPAPAHTQTVPADKESLENGEGAGMASYADLNGYPGPKHILENQEKLNLTEEQRKDIQSIFEGMRETARAKGDAIISKEVALEALFGNANATEAETERLSREIGALRGELRAIHLVAHVQAKQILTRDQVAIYNSIRNRMHQHKHGQ